MKKLQKYLDNYENVFHPIIIEDKATYEKFLATVKEGENTPYYTEEKPLTHDLQWHIEQSQELLSYLFDIKQDLEKDKKEKRIRFHKVNKFRNKRNMGIQLYWERQW